MRFGAKILFCFLYASKGLNYFLSGLVELLTRVNAKICLIYRSFLAHRAGTCLCGDGGQISSV